jgi:integrase
VFIRKTFPQVYALESPTKGKYWLVSARSKKWGREERKTFPTEELALKYARDLEAQVIQNGKQSDIPKERLQLAASYEELAARLSGYGRTPEEAVNHFLAHLGNEAAKQAKPFIRELVDSWRHFKYADSTLSHRTVVEIRSYARFIKTKWGGLKPDDLKRNDIDLLLKKLKIANNTRRKYLLYVRIFFSRMKAEGYIAQNPTDGIKYKVGGFNGAFYTPEDTKKLLRYVAEKEPDLIGYYALLTFAGLRPSEGAQVQWKDFSFATNELYVRPGKTGARHCLLEPAAVAWMKWHRDNSPKDAPFVQLRALPNREKRIREAVMGEDWIQDGLRHGFATYFKNLKNSIALVSDYMGNSPDVVKRHYARTIPAAGCQAFWALTPHVVLAEDQKTSPTPASRMPKGVDASEYEVSKGGVPPPMPVRNAEPVFSTGGDTYINVAECSPGRSHSNKAPTKVPAASGTT